MDQALKKQVKKYAVMTVIMVIMALAVVKLNNVTKTQLVNPQGRLLRQEKWSVSWKTTFRKTECVWGSRL